jgi:hypothetical protein
VIWIVLAVAGFVATFFLVKTRHWTTYLRLDEIPGVLLVLLSGRKRRRAMRAILRRRAREDRYVTVQSARRLPGLCGACQGPVPPGSTFCQPCRVYMARIGAEARRAGYGHAAAGPHTPHVARTGYSAARTDYEDARHDAQAAAGAQLPRRSGYQDEHVKYLEHLEHLEAHPYD